MDSCTLFLRMLPNIIGSLLSAAVAYLIYYLGHRKSKQKEEQRLMNLRSLFLLTLDNLKSGINAQIDELDKLIKVLEEDMKNHHTTFRVTGYALDSSPQSLLKIDKNDVYKFLVENKKDNQIVRGKLFLRLYDCLYAIEKTMVRIERKELENNKQYRISRHEIEQTMNKLVSLLLAETNRAINAGEVVKDPIYNKMADIYESFTDGKKYNIDGIMHSLFIPISKLIPQVEFVAHKDSQIIISLVQHAETHYSLILEDKANQLHNCKHWIMHYKDASAIVDGTLKIEFGI